MKRSWRIMILLFVLILSISCDLTTKDQARAYLKFSEAIQIVPDYIELRYTENDAIAFSMLKTIPQPRRTIIIYVTTTIAFLILGLLAFQSRRERLAWQIAFVLILSGAIGNLIDRIIDGHVIDFIHLHYKDQFSWPIFNIADVLITCGAILLALLMLTQHGTGHKDQDELQGQPADVLID